MKLRVHGDIDDRAGLRPEHEHSKHETHSRYLQYRLSFCCAYCSRPLARLGRLSSLQGLKPTNRSRSSCGMPSHGQKAGAFHRKPPASA